MCRNAQRVDAVLVATSSLALRAFLLPHLRKLTSEGIKVQAVCGRDDWYDSGALWPVPVSLVRLRRRISPLFDALALFQLWDLFRRLRPSVVHTHTPKAGLLGMAAAALSFVPVRIYNVNGLPLMTAKGWMLRLLRLTEQLTCRLATHIISDSESLRDFMYAEGLCQPGRIDVIGRGSSHGVDLVRFDPDQPFTLTGREMRRALSIPQDGFLLVYVGRVVKDKGLADLAKAWKRLRTHRADMHLVVCGSWEAFDPIPAEAAEALRSDPRVHLTVLPPERMPALYRAADLLVLPSYREGLPNVALEAAAMKVPIVATRVPGCLDAVQDGVTGLLVTPGDDQELFRAIDSLAHDPARRASMGEAGRKFVSQHYSEMEMVDRIVQLYRRLVAEARRPGEARAHGHVKAPV